ncbi:MAG: hypothetical protein E7167_00800 [Firmicutes bacterium]|nr:hypothetical protein [Bacillota bacterium]
MTATAIFILNLVVIFLIKVFDNILTTSKTILIQKNKAFLAGLSVVVSQVIFYKLIDAVSANGDLTMYVISVASGIGTILAVMISNRFSKERTYVNVLLCDDKKTMKKLRDFLKEHHITNLATDGYTKEWKKSIAITAYAETKSQSKIIDEYLNSLDVKIKRIISKN